MCVTRKIVNFTTLIGQSSDIEQWGHPTLTPACKGLFPELAKSTEGEVKG